ncbi:hypothetical protein K502DRAFT_368960 [Neoconidiobolus thromboides FSU 785]|nr:hypothetical protein K502DRAFT_368960 [Neoconidiobolus thromboides FSU 785]
MYFILTLIFYLPGILCNGMATHIEVSLRNIDRLPSNDAYHQLLTHHRSSLESGSYFPDFGYNCLNLPNQSEEAHWPTFYLYTLKYINQEYKSQLEKFLKDGYKENRESKMNKFYNLLSFLFGIVSHGTADVAWHSLDQRSLGFIDAFSKKDWNGNYGKAHTIADVGAEFVLNRMQSLDHISLIWHTPYEDIINIFKSMNYTNLNVIQLTTCMGVGYTATQAIKAKGKYALGGLDTNLAPFLLENYESYFKGGLNSLIDNVTYCWKDLIEWIGESNKAQTNKKGFCNIQFPKYKEIDLLNPIPIQQKEDILKNELPSKQIVDSITKVNDIKVTNEKESIKLASIKEILLNQGCNKKVDKISVYGKDPDSMFGSTIAVNNELKLIVVSAPIKFHSYNHFGSVFVYNFNLTLVNEIQAPGESLMSNGNFGKDIKFLGENELIITEPTYSSSENDLYQGRFHLYDLKTFTLKKTYSIPDILKSDKSYTNFAEKVIITDINNDSQLDLVVTSPNYSNNQFGLMGSICVYLKNNNEVLDQPNYCLFPNKLGNSQLFGSHIEAVKYNQTTYLIIGNPGNDSNGIIELIELDSKGYIKSRNTKIKGNGSIMNIGQYFKVDGDSLYVTATTKKNLTLSWLTNSVYQISLNILITINNPIEINESTSKFLDTSDQGSLLATKIINNNQLLIINHSLAQWESGQIYSYNKSNKKFNCLIKGEERDRLGTTMELIQFNNNTQLIVTSIHARTQDKRVGKLSIIQL